MLQIQYDAIAYFNPLRLFSFEKSIRHKFEVPPPLMLQFLSICLIAIDHGKVVFD